MTMKYTVCIPVAASAVVTFDAGQTLVELDVAMLSRRLAERGVRVVPGALRDALPAAWQRYDAAIAAGEPVTGHPWHVLVTALLDGAGVAAPLAPLVDWLWSEQPTQNLWRAPIADMIELARELAARGLAVGVVSNSEGRLAELFAEIGIAAPFATIVDSGRLGVAKPDPRIFAHALDALGGTPERAFHVGDSWQADVLGALGAGWRAIWYGRPATASESNPRVATARSAADVRAALVAWGVPA
jgi:putative hydrolase of the HAD superfamily